MKLLLDEMWAPAIAVQLRRRGFDVVSVAERPDLRHRSDDLVFAAAQAEERVIVTENAGDFRQAASRWVTQRGSHRGEVYPVVKTVDGAKEVKIGGAGES